MPAAVRTPERASAMTFSTSASAASSTPSPYPSLDQCNDTQHSHIEHVHGIAHDLFNETRLNQITQNIENLALNDTFSISRAISVMVFCSSGILINLMNKIAE